MIQEGLYVRKRTLTDFTILLREHMAALRWAAAVVLQNNNVALDKTDGKSSDRHSRSRASQKRRAGPQERRCRPRRGRKAGQFPPAGDKEERREGRAEQCGGRLSSGSRMRP